AADRSPSRVYTLCYAQSAPHRRLPSSPTRRSSDLDGQLKGLAGTRRRLAEPSRGGIKVLMANGVGDVEGRHFKRGQLLRIEPDADAVVALAEVIDIGHAIDAQQFIAHIQRGEVAQVDVVESTIGDEIDDHQDVRRLLPN